MVRGKEFERISRRNCSIEIFNPQCAIVFMDGWWLVLWQILFNCDAFCEVAGFVDIVATEHTNAIQQAIDSSDGDAIILLKDGTFMVNSMITLAENTTLLGDNATLKNIDRDASQWSNAPMLQMDSNCIIDSLVIDANNRDIGKRSGGFA